MCSLEEVERTAGETIVHIRTHRHTYKCTHGYEYKYVGAVKILGRGEVGVEGLAPSGLLTALEERWKLNVSVYV